MAQITLTYNQSSMEIFFEVMKFKMYVHIQKQVIKGLLFLIQLMTFHVWKLNILTEIKFITISSVGCAVQLSVAP